MNAGKDKARETQVPVDSRRYDREYFCSDCEGHEEFSTSGGRILSERLAAALAHADVRSGMRVLDVGCGRGESLIWLIRQGAEAWGLDYSTVALHLTRDTLRTAGVEEDTRYRPIASNARRLPFLPESFDRVLMVDVVEHLHPWELEQAFEEVRRVLKPGGKLIVHTAPNRWYYQFGYPLLRLFELLRGVRLPRDPRERFRYHQHMHVNEQSPRSLALALRRAGFRSRVWLADTQWRWADEGPLAYGLGWLVTHCYPFKWVFCGDILGEAFKA